MTFCEYCKHAFECAATEPWTDHGISFTSHLLRAWRHRPCPCAERLPCTVCVNRVCVSVESGLYFGFLLGLGQAAAWTAAPRAWTLPVAGALVGYVTNWLAIKVCIGGGATVPKVLWSHTSTADLVSLIAFVWAAVI